MAVRDRALIFGEFEIQKTKFSRASPRFSCSRRTTRCHRKGSQFMDKEIKFLPTKKADQISYAVQMHDVVSATGFVPTSINITPGDVTLLGTLLDADKGNHTAINNAASIKKQKTQDMSGPGGSHEQLMNHVRTIANAARVSTASDGVLASMGITRRSPGSTPKTVPQEPPEFTLASLKPGIINIRFREEGSAQPRARAATTTGVQIAVVDGTVAPADGEADAAPNQFVPRSPASLDSTNMPKQVRLYARWVTQRGLTGPWSLPLNVSVL